MIILSSPQYDQNTVENDVKFYFIHPSMKLGLIIKELIITLYQLLQLCMAHTVCSKLVTIQVIHRDAGDVSLVDQLKAEKNFHSFN